MKWQETEFENLYLIPSKNGLTRPSAVRGAGYKFINMGEIFAHDRIGSIDMERVQMNEKELDSMLVEEGDLLFARQSLVLAGAGKCSIIQEIDEPTTFESHIIRVRLRKDIIDPKFYYYYFKSPICKIKSIVTQGVQAGIRGNDLKKLKVHIPSLEIQQKIADILSKYDDLIENNRRRIELLEESARLLYREWFVYLRFPGHEHTPIIDGIPEGWEKKSAFDVMDILNGGTPKTSIEEYWNGGIPFFTPKDKTDTIYVSKTEKTLTEYGLKNCSSKLYPKDTIFITARGTVGRVNLAQKDMAMNQSCYALVGNYPINQYFLYFALRESVENIQGQAVGSVFDAIIKDTFKSIPFIVPSQLLINSYNESVISIIRQIDNLIVQNQKLQQARDILLPRLMNGEIAV